MLTGQAKKSRLGTKNMFLSNNFWAKKILNNEEKMKSCSCHKLSLEQKKKKMSCFIQPTGIIGISDQTFERVWQC